MNSIRFLPISYKLFSDMTFSVPSFLYLAVVGYPNLGLLNDQEKNEYTHKIPRKK